VASLEALWQVALEKSRQGSSFPAYQGAAREMNPTALGDDMTPRPAPCSRSAWRRRGADEMFTVLMGDAVEPAVFIEKHALDVANLDI